MPCNTVQTSRVDLGNVHLDTLSTAMRSAGWEVCQANGVFSAARLGVSLTIEGGAARIRTSGDAQAAAAEIKRTYAGHLLKTQAARFGWRVQQGAGGKLILQK